MPGALPGKRRQAKAEPPNEKHRERKPEHGVGVIGAELVGKQLRRRFLVLGLFDQADDFLQGTFAGRTQHQRFNRTPKIQGSSEDGVANVLFDRHGFPGQIRLVAGGLAFGDFRINWKLSAGLNQQAHSRSQPFHLHLALMALVVQDGGDFGRLAKQ